MQAFNRLNLPNFLSFGYAAIAQLGANPSGGRATFKAVKVGSNLRVVIKQFKFNSFDSSWTGFKAFEREAQLLQQLSHPRIPRYLDSFETPHGFCLIQEYKNAPTLADSGYFDEDKLKAIATSILEILIYLQSQNPPILHRDIKPENILVDAELNAYLVDFGFARAAGELGVSSMVVGTSGFMPPEQLLNRKLTPASDLYSLGATLICLAALIKSEELVNYIDENFRLDTGALLSNYLSYHFQGWIERLVQPRIFDRFQNANEALKALEAIDTLPEYELKLDEKMLTLISVSEVEEQPDITRGSADSLSPSMRPTIVMAATGIVAGLIATLFLNVTPTPRRVIVPSDSLDSVVVQPRVQTDTDTGMIPLLCIACAISAAPFLIAVLFRFLVLLSEP